MIHFKNHKGFSFIEMMIALTLLAIFGSSLFMMQSNLLTRLFKTHVHVINLFEMDKQILQFNQKLQDDLAEKKSLDAINLHKKNQNPEYVLDAKVKAINQNSALFKNFDKKIGIIQTTIQQDRRSSTWHTFAYIVPPEKKDSKSDQDYTNKQEKS